jgi:hypothetical protein
MRPHLALMVGALCACNEAVTAPPRPPNAVDVGVDFCLSPPGFFAYKNDGYDWVSMRTGSLITRFDFPATPRVTVVFGSGFGSGANSVSEVHVLNVTAQELLDGLCAEGVADKRLTGLVLGGASGDFTRIVMGRGLAVVFGQQSQFAMGVSDGPLDLIAHQRRVSAQSVETEKFIVWHGLNVPHLSPLPNLDFSSADARMLDSVSITVANATSSVLLGQVRFVTSRGTSLVIGNAAVLDNRGKVGVITPNSRGAGDVHGIWLLDSNGKTVTSYAAIPDDMQLTFGPELPQPTVSEIATTPWLQMRAELPAQPEYATFASATFSQSPTQFSDHAVTVTVSAAYLGGPPSPWTIDMPDLTAIPGFPAAWQLNSTIATGWYVEAVQARPALYFSPRTAVDGDVVRCAFRSSASASAGNLCRSPFGTDGFSVQP